MALTYFINSTEIGGVGVGEGGGGEGVGWEGGGRCLGHVRLM